MRNPPTDRATRWRPESECEFFGEQGHPEASVVRVLDDYGVLTVQLDKPTKLERMYKTSDVEVI